MALLCSELPIQAPGNRDQARASMKPGPGSSLGAAGGGREPEFPLALPSLNVTQAPFPQLEPFISPPGGTEDKGRI